MQFRWCREESEVVPIAKFFCKNITESYISHSELQSYRALAADRWSPNILTLIEEDIRSRLTASLDVQDGERVQLAAILEDQNQLVGVFLVTFNKDCAVPHAILEDMAVDSSRRGRGYGTAFMQWINGECRRRGIYRQFLESGINNRSAHDLFERQGFRQVSVVMMKESETEAH